MKGSLTPCPSYLHEEKASDERAALTVAHLSVMHRVGLQKREREGGYEGKEGKEGRKEGGRQGG